MDNIERLGREHCPIMKSIEIIGDKWILLILREAYLGYRRFDDFHKNLQISKSVLTTKLSRLVELGLLRKDAYQETGSRARYEYKLSRMGVEFGMVIIALLDWGNRHLQDDNELSYRIIDHMDREDVKLSLLNSKGAPIELPDTRLKTWKKQTKEAQ